MKTIEEIVAENLFTLMRQRGLSQAALAKAAGIDKDYLNKIIHARRRLGPEKEAPLAEALGCSVVDLYQRQPAAESKSAGPISSPAARILVAYEMGSQHTRNVIDAAVNAELAGRNLDEIVARLKLQSRKSQESKGS